MPTKPSVCQTGNMLPCVLTRTNCAPKRPFPGGDKSDNQIARYKSSDGPPDRRHSINQHSNHHEGPPRHLLPRGLCPGPERGQPEPDRDQAHLHPFRVLGRRQLLHREHQDRPRLKLEVDPCGTGLTNLKSFKCTSSTAQLTASILQNGLDSYLFCSLDD